MSPPALTFFDTLLTILGVNKDAPRRPAFEKVHPDQTHSFVCRSVVGSRFNAPYHYHPEVELTLITHSHGHRFIGSHAGPFKPGDLVLVGALLPHVWLNPPGCRRAEAIVLQFDPKLGGDPFWNLPELHPVNRLLARAGHGLVFTGKTRNKVSDILGSLLSTQGPGRLLLLLEILSLLAAARPASILSTGSPHPASPTQPHSDTETRIDRVYRHLAAHFHEPIAQPAIARNAGLSPAAFSRFFHRVTGRTFSSVLIDMRLGEACRLLQETDLPITDICHRAGFQNLSNFNRQFLARFHLPPRAWRSRFAPESLRTAPASA